MSADVGHYFREWRLLAGLTQDALGKAAGISAAQMNRLEKGLRDYHGRDLQNIMAAINRTLDRHPLFKGSKAMRIRHVSDLLSRKPPDASRAVYEQAKKIIADYEAIPPAPEGPRQPRKRGRPRKPKPEHER